MASIVEVNCKNCGTPKKVRKSDVKRGWGKYCSKSCKAKEQEKRTGQYAKYMNKYINNSMYNEHPFSSEALGQWND